MHMLLLEVCHLPKWIETYNIAYKDDYSMVHIYSLPNDQHQLQSPFNVMYLNYLYEPFGGYNPFDGDGISITSSIDHSRVGVGGQRKVYNTYEAPTDLHFQYINYQPVVLMIKHIDLLT